MLGGGKRRELGGVEHPGAGEDRRFIRVGGVNDGSGGRAGVLRCQGKRGGAPVDPAAQKDGGTAGALAGIQKPYGVAGFFQGCEGRSDGTGGGIRTGG